jgi:hypothetical protein
LEPFATGDFFVPCGGRPEAINLSNVASKKLLKNLKLKLILEYKKDIKFKHHLEKPIRKSQKYINKSLRCY